MNDHSYYARLALETRDTKTIIRREALRLFAEKGYSAVSMRELADAVGMRQGGIYNHFAGKQALLVDLMCNHMDALLKVLETRLNDVLGPAKRLRAFAEHHVTYHLDFPNDVFLAYMEIRSLDDDNRRVIVELRDQYERTLRGILEDGVSAGVFHVPDAAVHARMLLSMMTGATVWFRDGGCLGRDDVVAFYLQGVLQSVGLTVEVP
ncbi:TetR/AcrR family transcriptional regulator [Rhodobacteraceae bacterium]|nr:TetR/AcrR family transcriptional regulator [Paracoccaceae bacterium]